MHEKALQGSLWLLIVDKELRRTQFSVCVFFILSLVFLVLQCVSSEKLLDFFLQVSDPMSPPSPPSP